MQSPPTDIAAEQALLGSWLYDPATIDDTRAIVTPEDFWRDHHQAIATACLALRDRGEPVDFTTVYAELRATDKLKHLGETEDDAMDALSDLERRTPHALNAVAYARYVRDKANLRRGVIICETFVRGAESNTTPSAELIGKLEAELAGITELACPTTIGPIGTGVREVRERLTQRWSGRVVGISTPYPDLNEFIDVLTPGQLVIVAARPSVGKTALGLCIAQFAAALGKSVLISSLEMTRAELVQRLVAMGSRVPWQQIVKNELSPQERKKLEMAFDDIEAMDTLYLDDAPVQDPASLLAIARRHHRTHPLDLVVVDYLQIMQRPPGLNKQANRQNEVAAISAGLKRIARELHVPVIAMSQLNRQSENRESKCPNLADLRDSGAIEQDADIVILLHRPEMHDATQWPGVALVIVAKNRSGRTGSTKLAFLRDITKFENLATEPYVAAEEF